MADLVIAAKKVLFPRTILKVERKTALCKWVCQKREREIERKRVNYTTTIARLSFFDKNNPSDEEKNERLTEQNRSRAFALADYGMGLWRSASERRRRRPQQSLQRSAQVSSSINNVLSFSFKFCTEKEEMSSGDKRNDWPFLWSVRAQGIKGFPISPYSNSTL